METTQLVSGGVVTWTQAVRGQSLGNAAHQIPPRGTLWGLLCLVSGRGLRAESVPAHGWNDQARCRSHTWQHSALQPGSKNIRSSESGSSDNMGQKLHGAKSMGTPLATGHLHRAPSPPQCPGIPTVASSCPHPQTRPQGESHHHSPQLRVRVLLGPQGPTPSGLTPLCPQQHRLHSPSHSFCSGHMDTVPQTHQTHFHLRAFALPLPHPTISAWYPPSLEFLEMA